jgi:hypothetical protein
MTHRGTAGAARAACSMASLRSCALLETATPPWPPSLCGLARTSTRRTLCVRVRWLSWGDSSCLTALRVLQTGWTALMHAAGNGHTALATELVRLGADINAKNNVRACAVAELGRLIVADRGRCACCRWGGLRSCALLSRVGPPRPPSSLGLARTSTQRPMCVSSAAARLSHGGRGCAAQSALPLPD